MRPSDGPSLGFWIFKLFPTHAEEKFSSFCNCTKACWCVVVDKNLEGEKETTLKNAVNIRHEQTMVCAPLSHISITIAFRARGVG